MTRIHRRTSAVLATLVFLLLVTGPAEAKIRLGLVLEETERPWNERKLDTIGEQVINETTQAFLSSKSFIVAERQALQAVFQEKGLKGFIGDQEGSSLEETTGLEMLGLVSYAQGQRHDINGLPVETFNITVRLIDVATGEVFGTVDSKRPSVPLPSSIRKAGDDLRDNLRGMFPAEGYVIQLSGQEAVIDLGATLGLKKGDTLEVIEQGESVLHPVTGRELPGPERTVAKLKVKRVDMELSTCQLKSVEGEVSVGSRVRFQDKTSVFDAIGRRMPWNKGARR